MDTILLAVGQKENRRLLAELLSGRYRVRPFTSEDDLGEPFDVCVMDAPALSRLKTGVLERKRAEHPVFLPFVVLAARTDLGLASENLWQTVDELLVTPVERVEVLARLEVLLRTRRLSRELERRVQEAADLDRRKDEFLATLAHELRNPLAPIRNGLQLMRLSKHDDALAERSRAMMERQVGQMVRLIDDLLDVSRVTRDKLVLRPEPTDLSTVVGDAVETSRPLIESAGHELTVSESPEPLRLTADPARLTQVVANLLNNAAKYTRPGGRIWLTTEREGDTAVVRVRDTGVGISPEMLAKVFEMFAQVDHTTERAQGGLGIGLTLVRRLVEMHGGTVEGRSGGLGHGSEFVVRLPGLLPVPVAHVTPDVPAERPSGVAPRRVLVVDDNIDSAESLALLLRMGGHAVEVAHDGKAALEAARVFRPEVALLDIGLPGMSGYEVARRLREVFPADRLVLAASTGYGQDEDRRRSFEAGFDHHLVKPVELSALERILAAAPTPCERERLAANDG